METGIFRYWSDADLAHNRAVKVARLTNFEQRCEQTRQEIAILDQEIARREERTK